MFILLVSGMIYFYGHQFMVKQGDCRDTVSSIGIIRGKNLPGTVSPEHVCFFRHALALDERRVKFLPEYARGGVLLKEGGHREALNNNRDEGSPLTTVPADVTHGIDNEPVMEASKGTEMPRVKETWFTGTHSDM